MNRRRLFLRWHIGRGWLAMLATTTALLLVLAACGEAESTPTPRPSSPGTSSPVGNATPSPRATPGDSGPSTPSGSPTGQTGSIQHPNGADDLVVRIAHTGGFVPRETLLTTMPFFSLFGDGAVVTQGPQIAIYPPPALPNLVETQINEQGIQTILQAAEEAGLLEGDKHYELPIVADATTTVFTVVANGRTSVVSAYALGMDVPTSSLPPDEAEARKRLLEFERQMVNLLSWLPSSAIIEREAQYSIERLQIVVTPADQAPQGDPSVQPNRLDWPLSTSLAQFGQPYDRPGASARCGVVEGQELATLLPELQQSNALTRWASEGQEYVLYPRPLLPDETGCSDLE